MVRWSSRSADAQGEPPTADVGEVDDHSIAQATPVPTPMPI